MQGTVEQCLGRGWGELIKLQNLVQQNRRKKWFWCWKSAVVAISQNPSFRSFIFDVPQSIWRQFVFRLTIHVQNKGNYG